MRKFNKIKLEERRLLWEAFTEDTGLTICIGNRTEYEEWLENRLFNNLPVQCVSSYIDFEKLRQDYFNECVDKTNGKSKLYVCLAPHDLFEWFRKKLSEEKQNGKNYAADLHFGKSNMPARPLIPSVLPFMMLEEIKEDFYRAFGMS